MEDDDGSFKLFSHDFKGSIPFALWWHIGIVLCLVGVVMMRKAHARFMMQIRDPSISHERFSQMLEGRMFFVWVGVHGVFSVAVFIDQLRWASFAWAFSWQIWILCHFVFLMLFYMEKASLKSIKRGYAVILAVTYGVRAYLVGLPMSYIIRVSPIPFWTIVFCFWLDFKALSAWVTFWACFALLFRFVIPPWASPVINPHAIIERYSQPAVVVLVAIMIFLLNVRYDLFLYDKKLTYLATLKDNVLRELAHEIRTPLNGILGTLDLISSNRELRRVPGLRDQLSTIQYCASAVALVSTNVLMKDQAQTEKSQLVEFRTFMGNIMNVLNGFKYFKPDIMLQCRIAPRVPSHLRIFPNGLQQVLLNLGSNAIKYQERGLVTFYVDLEGPMMRVDVVDQGCGLSDEFLKAGIFKAYSRDVAKAGGVGGSGLGLYICKKLVRGMGGTISAIKGADQVGMVFTVRIPIIAADTIGQDGDGIARRLSTGSTSDGEEEDDERTSTSMVRSESDVPTIMQSASFSIAIVDDVKLNLILMGRMLEQIGMRDSSIHKHDDGYSCLRWIVSWAQEQPLDKRSLCVIIDKQMPGLGGDDLVSALRALEKPLGIRLFLAGFSAGEWTDAKLDFAIQKPVKLSDVSSLIDKATTRLKRSNKLVRR